MAKTRSGTRSVTAHRRKTPTPITAHEALQLLESAISYCQSAGLQVGAANGANGTLGLFIPNAYYVLLDNGTRAAFRLGAVPTVTAHQDAASIGTPGAGVSAQSIGTLSAQDAESIGTSSAGVTAQ